MLNSGVALIGLLLHGPTMGNGVLTLSCCVAVVFMIDRWLPAPLLITLTVILAEFMAPSGALPAWPATSTTP